jgi:hypothetical protein
MSEQDKPKNLVILGYVVAAIILLIVLVVGIAQYFQLALRDEIRHKQDAPTAIMRREQRQLEAQRQGEYRYVSQKDGTVRIPLARAQELVLAGWNDRPTAPVPQTPPPPPTPTPTPAPTPAPTTPSLDGGVAPATTPPTPAPAPDGGPAK